MGDFDPAALGRLRELICRFLPFLCKKKPKPKPKPNPVYEGCIAICNAYAQYCRGWGFAGRLCSRIAQLGCEKMCRDIQVVRMQSTSRIALHLVKVSRPIPSVWNVALGCVKGLDPALIKSARILATEM